LKYSPNDGRVTDRTKEETMSPSTPFTPEIAALEERLAVLEAEREIMRTLYDYGYALDYGDEEAFLDCWLPDATMHWPNPPYRAPFEGHEALRKAFSGHTHAPAIYHKHFVVDPRIAITGDSARVESYFTRLDTGADGPYLRGYGRYIDVLHRCPDGRWRFKERRAEGEAGSPRPRPGGPAGSASPA
jgi:ketosteroid isomerase-like protein